jgi:hypothetical protein
MAREWPFKDDPPNRATFTTVNVVEHAHPILFVYHDADGGAWQFLCGKTNEPKDGRLIGLDCALAKEPALAELADLPRGWRAWRNAPGEPWNREPWPADDREEE